MSDTPHENDPKTSLPRWARDLFLVAFIGVQLALPLHYYTLRDDPYDERFAWRMFSSTSMVRCETEIHHDGVLIELDDALPSTWASMLEKRHAKAVSDELVQRLCESSPDAVVTLALTCRGEAGHSEVLGDGETNLCEVLS
ncbi:MAG: hypothetical protein AAF533_19870 [Acidobacteriota bacterium]